MNESDPEFTKTSCKALRSKERKPVLGLDNGRKIGPMTFAAIAKQSWDLLGDREPYAKCSDTFDYMPNNKPPGGASDPGLAHRARW